MRWITRKNIKVDRVACPWLIRRFVDPQAEFLFVEESELLAAAAREKATPFDAPKLAEVKGQEQVAPEGIGLRAVAQGFAAIGLTDEERLVRQFPVYDALYEYAR